MTYREVRGWAAQELKAAGIENESAESRFLMEYACGIDYGFYLLHETEEMSGEALQRFQGLTRQRCRRIPLQYLTGEQEFMGLSFQVNSHVLIPRQDTEVLVEEALKVIRPGQRVLDLCTGSGCIAVSLKSFCPQAEVTGCDISGEALAVARENSERNGADVTFLESDLFFKIRGTYDVIVSNPPYIKSAVIPTLMPEVRDFEPMGALDGSEDGLYFYREIVKQGVSYLVPGGYLLFEIGYDQGEAVSSMMRENNFEEIAVISDLAGFDRVVKGRRKENV